MTEKQTQAPLPISDEELDAATGGAVGINPLLLLGAGAQGIYQVGPEPAPVPVAPGANPLYVENASHNTTPVYTPTHDVAPAPAATAVTHDVVPTPQPTVVHNDSTLLVVAPSGMGNSLNIAAPVSTSPLVITGSLNMTGAPMNLDLPPDTSQVSILTFNTTPTYTTVTPTVNGIRNAGSAPHAGAHSPLENAFDLSLSTNEIDNNPDPNH